MKKATFSFIENPMGEDDWFEGYCFDDQRPWNPETSYPWFTYEQAMKVMRAYNEWTKLCEDDENYEGMWYHHDDDMFTAINCNMESKSERMYITPHVGRIPMSRLYSFHIINIWHQSED